MVAWSERGGERERERERDALQGDEVRAAETEPSANSHTESEHGQTQLRGSTKLRADDDDTNIARGPQRTAGGERWRGERLPVSIRFLCRHRIGANVHMSLGYGADELTPSPETGSSPDVQTT
jgi:hypothetical protein